MRPRSTPIGLQLTRTARAVSRAFDEALTSAGGSVSTWQILIALKSQPEASQRDLAGAVGIQDATVTHHLNAMEASGLVTRRRAPDNRRTHIVEITAAGDALFRRLRAAAASFDQKLRGGLGPDQLAVFERVLARLAQNAGG